MDILLASKSPYRRQLFSRLGLEFKTLPSSVDETPYKKGLPIDCAKKLARLKAESVAKNHPQSLVIGGDQVADFKGQIIGKPKTREGTIERLLSLQGQTHQLHTATCIFWNGKKIEDMTSCQMQMRSLTREQIINYVDTDQPYDCAGGYKFESQGISLFEKIDAPDETAIVGLPLIWMANTLNELGQPTPQ